METLTPGFYYHYKHDPLLSINNFAYEIIGIGIHTEETPDPMDKYMVVYLPLYETFAYKNGRMLDLRPLSIFTSPATKNGVQIPRYQLITDDAIIYALVEIKAKMYGPKNDSSR